MRSLSGLAALAVLAAPVPVLAQESVSARTATGANPAPDGSGLSAWDIFALADQALARGDVRTALVAYQAVTRDRDLELRTEARFRLGMVLAKAGRLDEAARQLRQILDEKPGAARVRLELATLLLRMGDEQGARRMLREAQAGGLPPEVARVVDRYSAALRSRKPFGATLEVALAPDSNINRGTRSDTLGTVLGDFVLDKDARKRSGIGLSTRGQLYGRLPVGKKVNLLARINGHGDFYSRATFNDIALGLAVGPEFALGKDRLDMSVGAVRRWFGNDRYSSTLTFGVNYQFHLDRRSQLRASADLGMVDNHRNRLQDGRSYRGSLLYERAFSDRAGMGLSVSADRLDAKDAGYSTLAGQAMLFAYREFGGTTIVANVGYGRLRADRRLVLYPMRRKDEFVRASLSATFRRLSIGSFAPFARVTLERNRSTIEIFRYRRVRTELGFTRAF